MNNKYTSFLLIWHIINKLIIILTVETTLHYHPNGPLSADINSYSSTTPLPSRSALSNSYNATSKSLSLGLNPCIVAKLKSVALNSYFEILPSLSLSNIFIISTLEGPSV